MQTQPNINVSEYTWRDFLRIGAGIAMLVLGVIGLVLPILQGILFLIVAAALLAPYSQTVRNLLERSKQRFPNAHLRAQRIKEKFTSRKHAE